MLVLGGFGFYSNQLNNGKQNIKSKSLEGTGEKVYRTEDVERISSNTEREKQEKAQNMIDSIVKYQPPALLYPEEEPHVLTQLTDYSIAEDIHLYEVPPSWYSDERE